MKGSGRVLIQTYYPISCLDGRWKETKNRRENINVQAEIRTDNLWNASSNAVRSQTS